MPRLSEEREREIRFQARRMNLAAACERAVSGAHFCKSMEELGADAITDLLAELDTLRVEHAAIAETRRQVQVAKLRGWTPGRDVNPLPPRKVLLLHESGTVTVQESAEYVSLSCTHHRTLELPEGEPCRD